MYIYHLEDGKIVVDEAIHLEHWKQARKAMGLPETRVVAGTLVPLEDRYHKKYEEHFKARVDLSRRKALPEFVEPPEFTRTRVKQEAARKAREEKK